MQCKKKNDFFYSNENLKRIKKGVKMRLNIIFFMQNKNADIFGLVKCFHEIHPKRFCFKRNIHPSSQGVCVFLCIFIWSLKCAVCERKSSAGVFVKTMVSKVVCVQYNVTVYLQVKRINTFSLIALLSGVMGFLFST